MNAETSFNRRIELSRRPLGRTRLQVTPICIGTTALGNMETTYGFSVAKGTAKRTLRKVFSGPFNFIDTASNYGESEARIGEVLREIGGVPEGTILSTKIDRDMTTGEFTGAQAMKSLEQSLKLLGVNHIPIVFVHDPEHSTASFEDIMAVGGPVWMLQQYKKAGVIGHIGISGGPIDMLIDYVNTGAFDAVITHNRHNLLYQTAEPLFAAAESHDVAVINAAPYGSGMLAKGDTYRRLAYREAKKDELERLAGIQAVCDKYQIPLAAVALQFSLRDQRVASTIVGVSEEAHVNALEINATLPIPDALWGELKQFRKTDGDPEGH